MDDLIAPRPLPGRVALMLSVFESRPFDEIVAAMTEAAGFAELFYVERRRDGWRWTFASRGGPYPLKRVTARFLGLDHRVMVMPFRTVRGGYAIVSKPYRFGRPIAAGVLQLEGGASADEVRSAVASAVRPLRWWCRS